MVIILNLIELDRVLGLFVVLGVERPAPQFDYWAATMQYWCVILWFVLVRAHDIGVG